jgi:hypothetical protein
VRRPRAGLVTPHPGGPGQPSAGTKTGCLQWLDVAGTKDGGSRPDQGREERFRPAPGSAAPGTEKPLVARREARCTGNGAHHLWFASIGAPSPRIGKRRGK